MEYNNIINVLLKVLVVISINYYSVHFPSRLVTWLVVRRLNSTGSGLEVKIGGVGLLTLGGIHIKLGNIMLVSGT